MLLMIEKGIRGGICHAIYGYVKAINKYTKNYDKNKESSYFNYWDLNNLYGWAIPYKLSLGGVKWVEETSQFNKDLIKSYNKDSDIGHFIEADVQYTEELHELYNDLPCYLKD